MRWITGLLLLGVLSGCSNGSDSSQGNQPKERQSVEDSIAACTPIKDPNNPKPMALMMRLMAANADSIRASLLRGEGVDSTDYPFLRFYMAEPTDPKVLQPLFYENARLFKEAYTKIFRVPADQQITAFNAAIGMCVNCHMSYCNGPLKRIRKLPISSAP